MMWKRWRILWHWWRHTDNWGEADMGFGDIVRVGKFGASGWGGAVCGFGGVVVYEGWEVSVYIGVVCGTVVVCCGVIRSRVEHRARRCLTNQVSLKT